MGTMKPGSVIRLSFLVSLVFLCAIPVGIFAETFYACQGGDGSAPKAGAAAHAWDAAMVSLASNWASPKVSGKIGPGDTIHFMSNGGNIIGTGAVEDHISVITIRQSGTSGNPITLEGDGSVIIDGELVRKAIDAASKDYITLRNLGIKRGYQFTVGAYDCNYWIVENCNLSLCMYTQLHNGTLIGFSGSGWWVKNNNFRHNYIQHMIYCFANVDGTPSNNNLFEHNVFADSGEESGGSGIQFNGFDRLFTGNVVRHNLFYNNGYTGISLETGDGTEIYGNIFVHDKYTNQWMGILLGGDGEGTAHVKNTIIYNNLFYGLFHSMIYMTNNHYAGIPCIAEMYNNIFVSTGVGGGTSRYYINYESTDGYAAIEASDYNLFYSINGSAVWRLQNGTKPATLAAWKAAMSGFDLHSLNTDPLLVEPSPSVGNYRLQASSPCIGAAKGVGLTVDFDGVSIPQDGTPDIGPFERLSGAIGPPKGLRIRQ